MGKNTNKSTHKLVYKPDPNDVLEYILILGDVDLYKKYKEGDTTIPLVDVVDSYDVFTTNVGGNQGILERPSKQQLDATFGTTKEDDIVLAMIQKGEVKEYNDPRGNKFNNRNDASGAVSFGSMKGGAGGR